MALQAEYTIPEETEIVKRPLGMRIPAYFFSVVFHPLFMPTIVVAYLAFVQEGYFTGITTHEKKMIVVRVAVNTILFPLITVGLLRGLGFIKSIMLQTRRERVIPYVATNVFYFWIFLVFKNQPEVPSIVTAFILGVFLASSAALILNSFFKISMHGLGMGAALGILLMIIFSGHQFGTFLPVMVAILLTGIVSTSRLMVSNHTTFDIYSAILISILTQIISFYIIVG